MHNVSKSLFCLYICYLYIFLIILDNLLLREVKTEIAEKEVVDDPDSVGQQQCDCLPACTSLTYNAETSQADFNWPKLFESFKANFSEFPG